jgi:hypothetical protein
VRNREVAICDLKVYELLRSGSPPNERDCSHGTGGRRESEADFAVIRRKREHQLLYRN